MDNGRIDRIRRNIARKKVKRLLCKPLKLYLDPFKITILQSFTKLQISYPWMTLNVEYIFSKTPSKTSKLLVTTVNIVKNVKKFAPTGFNIQQIERMS